MGDNLVSSILSKYNILIKKKLKSMCSMVNKYIFLLALVVLSSCNNEDKQFVAMPYPVTMPVAVNCVDMMPREPLWDSDSLTKSSDDVALLKATLSDLANARAYIGELKAVLLACQ